jgi:hypothetical protein
MAEFVDFLKRLFEDGTVSLRNRPGIAAAERLPAHDVLVAAFADHALDVAEPVIEFDALLALAAAERVWWASWFLVQHAEPPAEVEQCLPPLERPTTAAQHLSGDLVLRFLPHVYRRARMRDLGDVLTRWLAQTLREWPLTGVLADIDEPPLTPIELDQHPGLLLLYAERLAEHPRPAWMPRDSALQYVELVFAERGLRVPPAALPAKTN